MRRILMVLVLAAAATRPVEAGTTFERARIAPELGLDAFTRGVARERLNRDVFASPWATVTLGAVDVYAGFPYVERRAFQIVSDPRWNRLVYGESGRGLAAWDGAGTPLGALARPRGLAVDDRQRVYVADAGNHRVVVLEAVTSGGDLTLEPRYAIVGLADPHDVAWSDGGTPFAPADDVLYVADTGRNRVVAFALGDGAAHAVAELGTLGDGEGRFAGPIAIAVGPRAAGHTADVYVADAHTRRIVHLVHEGAALRWAGAVRHGDALVTALDTDHWGNLYVAAPRPGVVRKLAPDLTPVAELRAGLADPRGFHVPFLTVRDHRDGRVERVGQASAVSLEPWGDTQGLRLWSLGLEIRGLAVAEDRARVSFTLTDRAQARLEVVDAARGAAVAGRDLGTLDAGAHVIALRGFERTALDAGIARVVATPGYAGAAPVMAQAVAAGAAVAAGGGLIGVYPNPIVANARLAFVVPAHAAADAALHVYDAAGRRVRSYRALAPGYQEVVWDVADERGARVPAGVYWGRLRVAGDETTQRLVVVR